LNYWLPDIGGIRELIEGFESFGYFGYYLELAVLHVSPLEFWRSDTNVMPSLEWAVNVGRWAIFAAR
jgi:hypothetical protein